MSIAASSSPDAPIPAPLAARIPLTRGPPANVGRLLARNEPAVLDEIALCLTEDHDRIAQGLTDVVVRRLFAAGLDLHAALDLIDDHPAAAKIHQGIRELDQAIRDIRDIIFDRSS